MDSSWNMRENKGEGEVKTTEMLVEKLGDRDSSLRVIKNYSDLHELIDSLSNKLTAVSSNVDKEFLSSYRVHMISIQSEIKNLKTDIVKGEQALNNDGTVAKLEYEVKWFVDECNRLKAHCEAMDTDVDELETRLISLKEQTAFLTDQLKSVMKRNRVAQAEIQFAKTQLGLTDASTSGLLGPVTQLGGSHSRPSRSAGGRNVSPPQSGDLESAYGGSMGASIDLKGSESVRSMSRGGESQPIIRNSNSRMAGTTGKIGSRGDGGVFDDKMRKNYTSTPNLHVSNTSGLKSGTGRRTAGSRTHYRRTLSPTDIEAVPAIEGDTRPLSPMRCLSPEQKAAERAVIAGAVNRKKFNKVATSVSIAERDLGRAIEAVFEEIQDRKDDQKKRASVRRHFANNNHKILSRMASSMSPPKSPDSNNNMSSKSLSGHVKGAPPPPLSHSGGKGGGGIFGVESMHEHEAEEAQHSLFIRSPSKYFVQQFESGVPKIAKNGGLSGLGLDAFSDNDRFAAVVKFLMQYENFNNVTNRLYYRSQMYQGSDDI